MLKPGSLYLHPTGGKRDGAIHATVSCNGGGLTTMTTEGRLTRLDASSASVTIVWRSLAGGAMALSWLYLNRAALVWLGQAMQEAAQFNQLVLGLLGLVLLVQGVRYRQHFALRGLTIQGGPLAVMVICGVGAIALHWLIDFEQLPVVLFLLGSYGVLGLFMASATWRKGLVIATAIACVLPFGVQFETGLGFPARILTANIVEHVLASFQVGALSSENILVLENGIARVDLPCSGLKSLWTGALYFLAATWLENRQLGFRWLLVGAVHLLLLIGANIARVMTLVLLFHPLHQPELATLLHVPLGLLSFMAVCLLTWGLLRLVPRQGAIAPFSSVRAHGAVGGLKAAWIGGLVAIGLISLALIPLPVTVNGAPASLAHLPFPADVQVQPMPLSQVEQEFFADQANAVATKQRFQFHGLSGSMLVVASASWRSHHPPELCLLGSGYRVNHMEPRHFTPAVVGRWLQLNDGAQSAAYWFQSPRRTTDQFLDRIWGEVSRQEPSWVMASMVFDTAYDVTDSTVTSLIAQVHDALDRHLKGDA